MFRCMPAGVCLLLSLILLSMPVPAQASPQAMFSLREWVFSMAGRTVLLETAQGRAITSRIMGRAITRPDELDGFIERLARVDDLDTLIVSEVNLRERFIRIHERLRRHPMTPHRPTETLHAISRQELQLNVGQRDWIAFMPMPSLSVTTDLSLARRIFLGEAPRLDTLIARTRAGALELEVLYEALPAGALADPGLRSVILKQLAGWTAELEGVTASVRSAPLSEAQTAEIRRIVGNARDFERRTGQLRSRLRHKIALEDELGTVDRMESALELLTRRMSRARSQLTAELAQAR